MKKLALIFVVVLCAGCAALLVPSEEQFAKADYGEYPSNYEEIVKQHITGYLLDPESARFSDWKEPKKDWFRDRGLHFGYRVCVRVNAKNRMGGYTGKKLTYLLIKNGRIIGTEGGDYRYGSVGEEDVEKLCRKY